MYIRFESRLRDPDSRGHCGIFWAAEHLWHVRPECLESWQSDEICRLMAWFNRHLDVPQALTYRPGRKAELSGLCWFKAASARCVSQGRYLAWLLTDLGQPIEERKAPSLGTILWQDADQVVALRRR